MGQPMFRFCRLQLGQERSVDKVMPNVAFGSASAGHAPDLTAGKLTSKLSDRTADVRGRQ